MRESTVTKIEHSRLEKAAHLISDLESNIAKVIKGKDLVIRASITSLLARGHLLVEDVPGVGKTTLAQALARSLGVTFHRIQFTSDLLPSDILGISIFNQSEQKFEFVAGPIFANVVLADEINRATPKTQSALLEAMSESTVSVERKRYRLTEPFFVVATQNPLEFHGTFPLPESQLDRFLMSINIGYPSLEDEKALLLAGGVEDELENLGPVLPLNDLLNLQSMVQEVKVSPKIAEYLMNIVDATRHKREFVLGVSTRGALGFYRAAQANALCEGRDFVTPDDIKSLATSILSHRIVLRQGSGSFEEGRRVIQLLLDRVPVPL